MEIITCNNNEIKINTYLIKKHNHAIVIDPNNYDEIIKELEKFNLDYIFLTHEHFDHIMAVDKLRNKYKAKVIAHEETSKNIQLSSKNLSKYSNVILDFMNIKTKVDICEIEIKKADIIFEKEYNLKWLDYKFTFISTPGHTKGSICILVDDILFSGDYLFELFDTDIKGFNISREDYFNITIPFFKSLEKTTKVYPGHYNQFILGNKKFLNYFKRREKNEDNYK